jgi:hypothetical protein
LASTSSRSTQLWWLPLLAGLLPMIGATLAFQAAVAEGQFASCNPWLEGCVSVSRAGRHGLANHLFRALLLPAAVLQGLVWLLSAPWLRGIGTPPSRWLSWLPWFGIGAAVFLILYGTFLGTEGDWYRWMRRYGVIFYFGFTCILMVITGGSVHRAATATRRGRRSATLLLSMCAALPLLGVVNTMAPLAIGDPIALDHFENATEWWGTLIFQLFFLLLALLWRRTAYGAELKLAP